MQLFARLTKVNEAERTVEGIIASETPDGAREVFDYEKSKPNFVKWSEGIAKATEGKSLGNVRAQHGKVVAGITKVLDLNDETKQIFVKSEIVDDNEWNKVLKGCYTGFSIGGAYGVKWDDPVQKGVKRYEAIPNEYSLVDIPCNPDAQFTVIKADGAEELRKFETSTDNAEALAKWAEGLTDGERAAVLAKVAPAQPEPLAKDISAQAERLAKTDGADIAGNAIRIVLGMGALEKGLWSVASFAETLQRLACIADDADGEAAWEGDGSKVPAQLREALKPLAAAFLAMAQEEVNEAIKPATEEVIILELAAGGDLAKALGVETGAGAMEKVTEAVAALAKAQSDLATSNEALTKVTTERDDALTKVAELTKGYADWLSQPAPAKGAVRAVEKGLGVQDPKPADVSGPVVKGDGTIDHVATAQQMMKAAHSQPLTGGQFRP